MHTRTSFALITLFCFSNAAHAEHRNLNEAADALRKANGTHNIEDLQEARRKLHAAVVAKDVTAPTLRKAALRDVDAALTALRAGNRVQADKLMGEALKNIEGARARGKDK